MNDANDRMICLIEAAAANLQQALEHMQLAANKHAARVAALTRALAESHAERDRLAEELRKAGS